MIPFMKMHQISATMVQKSEIVNIGGKILILVFWNMKQQQTEGLCVFLNMTGWSRLPDQSQEATEEAARAGSLRDPHCWWGLQKPGNG